MHIQQQLLLIALHGPNNYLRYAANHLEWACAYAAAAAAAANSFTWV